MKYVKTLMVLAVVVFNIYMPSVLANPYIGGEIVTEYTNIPKGPAVIEGTIRLQIEQPLNEYFYLNGRAKYHMINNEAYDNKDCTYYDRAFIGYRNKNTEVRLGQQWLYLGKGLLADINERGLKITTEFDNGNLSLFFNNDVQAMDIILNKGKVSLGATYKRHFNQDYDDIANQVLAVNFIMPFLDKTYFSGEYVFNTTQKAQGYILEFNKRPYSLSYRNIENKAIDASWANSYHYADSKGLRLRADYKIGNNGIFTVYQDIAKNYRENKSKNITYLGYAKYFY